MNFIKFTVLTCLATLGLALPAQATYTQIYTVLGVTDDGSLGDLGVATSVHCTNLSNNPVNVRVHARRYDGTVAGNVVIKAIPKLGTLTFSTHSVALFSDASQPLVTGAIFQGHIQIQTEAPAAIVCAADMIDAAGNPPTFVAPRRMIRMPRSTSGAED